MITSRTRAPRKESSPGPRMQLDPKPVFGGTYKPRKRKDEDEYKPSRVKLEDDEYRPGGR